MSGYLNFKPTGVPEIDAILRAIEVAGDAYHHTEDWGDDDNGESHIDRIQKAADAAALARKGAEASGMKLNIDPEKFLAAVDREGDHEVGVGYAAARDARRGAAMQWRPIEEAPKDGTEFIAYRPDAGVFTANYDDEQDVWFANHGYEDITDDLPTHWMPFPPPPKGAEE